MSELQLEEDILDNNIFNESNINEDNTTHNNSLFNDSNSVDSSHNIPVSNCLALTVRKDYNLTIFKNLFTTSGRISLKVALSTLILNILRMFF